MKGSKSDIKNSFDEEDWSEESHSIYLLGQILDDIQNKKTTKKTINDYVVQKSVISSKEDPEKELLFLREYVIILSQSVVECVNKELHKLKSVKEETEGEKVNIVDLENPLYSVTQVSKILNLTRQSVYNLIASGHIRVIKFENKSMKISQQDLSDFIKKYRH